jgi:glycosyltransferase involved in cell wall biosynthesis
LILGPLPPPIGGVETFTQALLESGAFAAFEVAHCDTTKGRPKSTQGRFDFGNFAWAARHLVRLWRAMARVRPDVVYMPVAGTWSGFLRDMALARVARRSGTRLVGHVHGSDFQFVLERGGRDRAIVHAGLARFDRLLVLGGRWRELLSDAGVGVPCDVVPSTFRREVFERAARNGPARPPDGVTRALFVGQVGKRKGTFDVLRALPDVHRAGADVHVTFVGPPELTGEWEALLAARAELGLEATTTFAGQLQGDALYARYRDADCFVMPSYTEGLPVVLFEAGVFGLPAITTPVGSIPDLVVDDRNGLLVAPGDRAQLVAALVRMAREPDARVRMGRQLQQDVQAFHPDRVCARVAAAIQATLSA